eukprot:m.84752 g.84752  ORF g.84752 m.84752 type:complete len:53 (+) comp25798_c0_seq4:120-278(+)
MTRIVSTEKNPNNVSVSYITIARMRSYLFGIRLISLVAHCAVDSIVYNYLSV